MSQQIPNAFVNQYKANVDFLYQQTGSKLRGAVRERSVNGAADFWDLLGPTAAVKKNTRHGDTPQVDTPHTRRMVVPVDYEWADLIDKQDDYRIILTDLKSSYAINAARGMQRAFDDEVILAFSADAKTGQNGGTTVVFDADYPNGNRASSGAGDEDFEAAAMTVANLVTLKMDLDNYDIPADGRYIIGPPSMFGQLLKASTAPQISSADYNTVRALVNGEINTFLGFTFISSTRLPSRTTNMRYGFAWHRDAMGISVGMEMLTRVGERADKSYAMQVYCAMSMGAARIQGAGVVRFSIDETK